MPESGMPVLPISSYEETPSGWVPRPETKRSCRLGWAAAFGAGAAPAPT